MTLCEGCGGTFTPSGHSKHLAQTRDPRCVAAYQHLLDEQLPGVFDNDVHMADDNEGADPDDPQDMDIDGGEGALDEEDFYGPFFEEDVRVGGEIDLGEAMDGAGAAGDGEDDEEIEEDPVVYAPGPALEARPEPLPPAPLHPSSSQDQREAAAAAASPNGRVHVEQALRQEVHIKYFPSERAGEVVRNSQSVFGAYAEGRNLDGNAVYAPFASERDFQIARWAKMRGPGSTA